MLSYRQPSFLRRKSTSWRRSAKALFKSDFCSLQSAAVIGAKNQLSALRQKTDIIDKSALNVFKGRIIILMIAFDRGKNNFLRKKRHKVSLIFAGFSNKKRFF